VGKSYEKKLGKAKIKSQFHCFVVWMLAIYYDYINHLFSKPNNTISEIKTLRFNFDKSHSLSSKNKKTESDVLP
jgi:hypothetical protein